MTQNIKMDKSINQKKNPNIKKSKYNLTLKKKI